MEEPRWHELGLEAHVMIKLAQGIDIFDASMEVEAVRPRTAWAGDFTLIHLHRGARGDFDLMADIHCGWTNPRGMETRTLGDWMNLVGMLQKDGRAVVAATSITFCINHP